MTSQGYGYCKVNTKCSEETTVTYSRNRRRRNGKTKPHIGLDPIHAGFWAGYAESVLRAKAAAAAEYAKAKAERKVERGAIAAREAELTQEGGGHY